MGANFLAGQASLWVQPDGPNTEPKYLGCHDIADIPGPKGDSTTLWQPDPAHAGQFVAKNSYKGTPATITSTITTDLRKTADYLEDLAEHGCPFPLYVHKVSCGRRDVFSNFDRSFVLRGVEITNATLQKLAAKDPGNEGESGQSFAISIQEVLRCFNMEMTRLSTTETEDFTGIAICGEDRCAGDCGLGQKREDYLVAAAKALVGSANSKADVLHSDRGGAWTWTAADPFASAKDIQGMICIRMSNTVTRWIVGIGTTGAGPCSIAYSDNGGVTWTTVLVGSTNAEFVKSSHSLVALDRYHIWLGSNLGRIYFSSDAGVTWTVQENAAISATAIMGISMYDFNNGYAVYTGGQVAKTSDGTSWSAVTTSGATTATDVSALTSDEVFVSGANGLFGSMDAGVTWTSRDSSAIGAIDFLNELFGMTVGSGASGNVKFTIDGGYDWITLPAVTNGGLTDVVCVSSKLAYVAGKATGGFGFLGKVLPVT